MSNSDLDGHAANDDRLAVQTSGGGARHAALDARPQILCAMRMPPNLDGHGGSQRAWHLLQALRAQGHVHFVLFYRPQDLDCVNTSLEPIEPLCASVTRIQIAGWEGALRKKWSVVPRKVIDVLTLGSHEAPSLSDAQLADICERLPIDRPDLLFAGRLCCAWILQSLIERGRLTSRYCIVDYDDIMSKFRSRQIVVAGPNMSRGARMMGRIDAWLIGRAERNIARNWHGVSVCTDEDVANLRVSRPAATVAKIANVVEREYLPIRSPDGDFRVLFAGNLSFTANIDGLMAFVHAAWPQLLRDVPTAKLSIVGLNPPPMLVDVAQRNGFELSANVPSLRPFYLNCDVVIAPILFGSGTRIKILEAMAYGRPVVSTPMGAEGLGLEHGVHLLTADSMPDFARALTDLAREPERGHRLAERARRFQEQNFAPVSFRAAVSRWVSDSRSNADQRRKNNG